MKTIYVLALIVALIGIGCDRETERQAARITGGTPSKGKDAIGLYGCASCHTIPGIRGADALVGPPLMKMAKRTYIAGVMRNTPANMIQWLQNPPGVDPMTAMPNVHMSEREAKDIASYLYTLK